MMRRDTDRRQKYDSLQGKKKSGVFTYSSGGRYIGELQGGRRHGRGSFLYPDGSSYEGQWQDNVKHGEIDGSMDQ